uniref:Protein-tyrosine-phosphatase n=1 Tax=Globodera pallida TaxID=36090 RepID=A0A183BMR4_GLOPA
MSIRRSRIIHRRHAPQNRCVSSLSQCSTTATAVILPTTSPSSCCDRARFVISLTYLIGTGLAMHRCLLLFVRLVLPLLFILSLHRASAEFGPSPSVVPSPTAFRLEALASTDAATNFDVIRLRIEKDHQDPSRLLDVFLPQRQSSISSHFRQFIARVTDISFVEMRDANRTFLASLADSSVINVHGLNPGHKYSVAILGRREAESILIREDQVLMDPVPLDFGIPGNSSAILATATNITMRAQKPDRALQDTFRVEYHQLDPLKRFPILDVHDIQEQREVELYLGNLSPGRDYAVSITSLREELPSQPWRGIVTTKPLRPVNLSVVELNTSCVLFSWLLPARFRVRAHLAPDNESHTEKCQLWVEPEQGGRLEQTVQVQQGERHCEALFELFPGRRYEISAAALSGQSTSTRVLRNKPVEPGFDFAAFGLSLREGDVGSGTLRLEWPQSEVARLRIADLWARIVGRDSHLHFSIQPLEADSVDQQQQVETGPTEPEPVLIDGVLLYTVTSSGIVSEQRFEQFIRVRPPQLDLTVGQLSARSTTLQAFLYRPKHHNNGTSSTIAPRGVDETALISAQCHLHVVVTDALDSAEVVTDRTLSLSDQRASPSVALVGLKPFHKYVADAQVNCGEDYGQQQQQHHGGCASKFHQLNKLEFRTQPAQPGPIGNLTVRPLNSYSALMRWLSPEEPNGQIVHYIVQIEPQNNEDDDVDDQQRPWTEKVVASSSSSSAGGESAEVSAEGLLVEKVLDGLAGGRRYRLEVWPVNEAGQGRGSGLVQLDVPISKPPRPGQIAEVLSDSIRTQQLRVRIDTAQLSERNGRLIKIALIVAEANENGEVEEDELVGEEAGQGVQQQDSGDNGNGNGTAMPTTWAMARRVPGRWPSFVALEALATGLVGTRHFQHQKEPNGFRFGQKVLLETVGDEAGCEERPATAICNGPLKADTSYRIKLRVFTDSVLWADSPWTELIHTGRTLLN